MESLVVNYQWSVDQVLPLTLDELAKQPGPGINYRGPVGAAPYSTRLLVPGRTAVPSSTVSQKQKIELVTGPRHRRRCFRKSVKEVVR